MTRRVLIVIISASLLSCAAAYSYCLLSKSDFRVFGNLASRVKRSFVRQIDSAEFANDEARKLTESHIHNLT